MQDCIVHQGYTNPGHHVALETKFSSVVPIILCYSVWTLFRVTLLATGILRWLLGILGYLFIRVSDHSYLLCHLNNWQVAEIFGIVLNITVFHTYSTRGYRRHKKRRQNLPPKTLVHFYQTTRFHVPEENNLHIHTLLLLFWWWELSALQPWRLIVLQPPSGVPSFISRGAAHQAAWETSASEGRN
jgi:hypothetical protein